MEFLCQQPLQIMICLLSFIFSYRSPLGVVGLFRQNLCEVLHHHYFQIIICVLVLLDTAVVVTEIMVESSQAKCNVTLYTRLSINLDSRAVFLSHRGSDTGLRGKTRSGVKGPEDKNWRVHQIFESEKKISPVAEV